MSKLLRIVLAIVIAIWTMPVFADTIGNSEVIPIGVTMPATGAGIVNVELRNRSNDAIAAALAINAGVATLAAPWIAADQYLDVDYSATYNSTWGVGIVTDNEDLELDLNNTIENIVVNRTGAGPDGIWGNADDIVSYAGLIGDDVLDAGTDDDPSLRAALAWQVFAATQPAITAPASSIAPDPVLGGTVLSDKNIPAIDADSIAGSGASWNAAWAYIGDKNDTGYTIDILDDLDGDGADDDMMYSMVLVGSSGGGTGTLAQHPQATPKPGDPTGIAIYLAARFANTNWGNSGDAPTAFVLPPDGYGTSLYVEMIHE